MLTIYVMKECPGCERARRTARDVQRRLPGVAVAVVDLSTEEAPPENIFGVPAYVLDGRVISHGNPRLDTLIELLTKTTGTDHDDDQ
jgi:glutaredoxin